MIAEQFTPLDIECLVKTAVELWEEIDISDLSERQQEVLDRARTAMFTDHVGQAPTVPVVTTLVEADSLEVWVLRRWDRHHDEVTLWPDEDAALKELATYARSNWANVAYQEDVPDQPPADDREAVQLYYGPEGERGDEGYTIYADEVHTSVPPSGTRLVAKDGARGLWVYRYPEPVRPAGASGIPAPPTTPSPIRSHGGAMKKAHEDIVGEHTIASRHVLIQCITWKGTSRRSFDVLDAETHEELTDESFDEYPTDEQIKDVLDGLELVALAEGVGLTPEDLDEAVHGTASKRASEVKQRRSGGPDRLSDRRLRTERRPVGDRRLPPRAPMSRHLALRLPPDVVPVQTKGARPHRPSSSHEEDM